MRFATIRFAVPALLGAVVLTLLPVACDYYADPADATAYERCRGEEGEPCSDGTSCLAARCSKPCTEDTDCPAADGLEVACESFYDGRRCVVRCTANPACPDDQSCLEIPRINGEETSVCF